MHRFLLISLAILLFADVNSMHAHERYYVMIFGAQRDNAHPKYTHSFATFVRVSSLPQNKIISHHTISWLPASGDIRVFPFRSEPGRNYDIHETMQFVLKNKERVSIWGPFEIRKDLFDRSIAAWNKLKCGPYRYKAADFGCTRPGVMNCIHAVHSVISNRYVSKARFTWGESASYHLMNNYRPWFINHRCRHPWLLDALGISCYPMIQRGMDHPRTGWLARRLSCFH